MEVLVAQWEVYVCAGFCKGHCLEEGFVRQLIIYIYIYIITWHTSLELRNCTGRQSLVKSDMDQTCQNLVVGSN